MTFSSPAPQPPDVPLRVVFGTVDAGMPGGIPVSEIPFQQALGATGQVEIHVLPFGRRRPDESPLRRMWTRLADLASYAATVRRVRPDLVHLDTAFDARALARDLGYVAISRALGQPLFLKMHGSQDDLLRTRSPFLRWMIARVLRGAAGIGVLSTEEKANFAAAGFGADRFHVLPNAVDGRRFESSSWPRPGPPRLLFIARMVETKGLPDVLDALRRLRGEGRDVRLTCVGDGPVRAESEAMAGALGIAGAVTFTGQVPEAEATRHYLDSTMLVFPTRREGFSMTIFQSLAAGLPIVTTRIRAAADHLREPDHCLWVPPRDPARLAERVGWLLDHPETMAAMWRANLEHAKRFRAERVAADYLDLYRRIARPRTRATRASTTATTVGAA